MQTTTESDNEGPPSSSFVADLLGANEDVENISPNKFSELPTKSPTDCEITSPLKLLKSRGASPPKVQIVSDSSESLVSPRRISSPIRRFPVKPSAPSKAQITERTVSIDDVLRDNEGLTKAIEILEDGDSFNEELELDDNVGSLAGKTAVSEDQYMDDTMVSTFSEFSALPETAVFAKIGQTPSKHASMPPTPRRAQISTPATLRRPGRSPSPSSRSHRYTQSRDDSHTEHLMDFTEQFSGFSGHSQQTPRRQSRPALYKNTTMPDLSWASTPSNRHMSNLLDFDIPPAPTPRSLPSITPRELESLKSNFLSQISSLKASLSGKEAELQFLKTAVGDAEKRVGESLEQIREERDLKAQLAVEKEEWEKRSREMEAVLRNVKEEIMHGEKERDDLEGRLDESEGRRQAAEMMAQEAESKMASMKAGKPQPSSPGRSSPECACGGAGSPGGDAKAVEIAVEKVSRDLHTLYKDKHETKVSALKKSYEKRWDKKVRDLEIQVEELTRENEDLRRDMTMTRVDPRKNAEEMERQAAQESKLRNYEAELENLSEAIRGMKQDNYELRRHLDEERLEKGKLVTAVDEMIPLIAAYDEMISNVEATSMVTSPSKIARSLSQSSNPDMGFQRSITRSSGLRAPTGKSNMNPAESRIGRGGFGAPQTVKDRSGSGSGVPRPGSGMGYRSGIGSSIEKMGSYKGRGE